MRDPEKVLLDAALAVALGGGWLTPLMGLVDHGRDGCREPVAGLLRPGNAGSNTAADHIEAARLTLAQLPKSHRISVVDSEVPERGEDGCLRHHRLATLRASSARYWIASAIRSPGPGRRQVPGGRQLLLPEAFAVSQKALSGPVVGPQPRSR